MGLDFSFSADRCFRQCQHQFFFREIAACHNSKDPLRHEAFILKQLKTLELWRGLLIHEGIEKFVVPAWQSHHAVDWSGAAEATIDLARRQFRFSRAKRYRDPSYSKSQNEDFCALVAHENNQDITSDQFSNFKNSIELAFRNLSGMHDLLATIEGRPKYWSECPLSIQYHDARILAQADLLFFRGYGQPTIIDWKAYESRGGSDAGVQTALYAWIMCRSPKWNVRNAADIELIEVKLLDGTIVRHRFDEERFAALEDRVYRSIEQWRALCGDGRYLLQDLREYEFAANPNSCGFCNFRTLCQQEDQCLTIF